MYFQLGCYIYVEVNHASKLRLTTLVGPLTLGNLEANGNSPYVWAVPAIEGIRTIAIGAH